ncbi:acyl-CoA dehydrogenase family protein [Nocardia tengchongensis]
MTLGQVSAYMTPERHDLQAMAREFALKEVLPVANELDPIEGLIPDELIKKMADIGFFGILVPEEHGGLGLGVFEYCMIAEELSRAWMSVGSLLARGNSIIGGFSEAQQAALLPRVARGEYLGAMALSESNAGSDVANISCRARRDGDDWVINGQKMWCTFADGADFIILMARTSSDPDPAKRHAGISAFLIDKERGTFPDGISGTPMRKIGYRGWKTWELSFSDFRLPGSALLGEEGRGFYTVMNKLETARAHTAARSIGLARGALEDAIEYAQQRVQFQRPIAENQAIRFKLAEMATRIEMNRQLMYHVCTIIDNGGRCDLEASMVKYAAAEMSEWVTSEGLQIHGGAGYTSEFAAERYWRDARLTRIFEGTSEIQLQIISDRILGKTKN